MRLAPAYAAILLLFPALHVCWASPNDIVLSAGAGANAADIVLQWTGSQPTFEVHRSTSAAAVIGPGDLLGETAGRSFTDPEAPAQVFFYQVVRKPDPPATIAPAAPDHVLLIGTVVGPGGPFEGEILVEGNLITCVAGSCSAEPGATGATVITTNGIILPGLIDTHNHGLFDIFDASDWTPAHAYLDHNQWPAETRYQQVLNAKQYLNGEAGSPVDVGCEMDKYAEIKALIAGTTSIVVDPGALNRACYASLVRTIDTPQNDLGADRIQTSVLVPSNSAAQSVCNNFASGATDAYLVHVAEGIDATSLGEFGSLASRAVGCLMSPKTTIVHGTALGSSEFATMAAAGMKLVWSPKSDVFLYGDTARIDLALQAGVPAIALAPNWTLGGSVNLLDELRFADGIDQAKFGNILSAQRLFQMVAPDAARVLGLDSVIGSLEVGKRADITVIGGYRPAPYDALLLASPVSVRLVIVEGQALYGDADLVAAAPSSPGCEAVAICGASKFLCVAETSTLNKLDQTYAGILQALATALADYDSTVIPLGVPAFTPIAPLTLCE